MFPVFCNGHFRKFKKTMGNNKNRIIRQVAKAGVLGPTALLFHPQIFLHREDPRVSHLIGCFREAVLEGGDGAIIFRTRPVNLVVESLNSVGSGRSFFKWTADFETRRKGVRKRNSTAFDNCPAAFPPQHACSEGTRLRQAHPRARAAHLGESPTRRPPASAPQPPRFVFGVALGRPLSHVSLSAAVTRSPISWWTLLKRPRSRSRTKAIVLFPPLDSASLPEWPSVQNDFHCICA